MAKMWQAVIDGKQHGPLSSSDLKSLAESGRLNPQDHVWKEGLPDWIQAVKVKGLFPSPAPPPIPSSPSPTSLQSQDFEIGDDRTGALHAQTLPNTRSHQRSPLIAASSILGIFILLAAIVIVVWKDKPAQTHKEEPAMVAEEEPVTIEAADEEFRIAASHKGDYAMAGATTMIKFRNEDRWPWERIEGVIDGQFPIVKPDFENWRQMRISAGDRYE